VIAFTVFGQPEPGGSKRAFVTGGRARVVDANPRAKGWKDRVAQVAGEHFQGELLDGPLELELTFYSPRPRSHYRTGKNSHRLRDSAPEFPTTRPDAGKLARATTDALTGVLWRDDAQVVDDHHYKRYGAPARCVVRIRRKDSLPPEAVGTLESVAA
jgi:Holliday junction resolvase RusA-like endonuclease